MVANSNMIIMIGILLESYWNNASFGGGFAHFWVGLREVRQ